MIRYNPPVGGGGGTVDQTARDAADAAQSTANTAIANAATAQGRADDAYALASLGGSGWTTVLDLDFTTLPAQSLASDGNYVLGGKTWTKINTAHEVGGAPMNVGAGGLEFRPAATGANYGAGTERRAPALLLPLLSVAPGLTFDSSLRLWVYVKSCNAAASYDNCGGGIANAGAFPGTDASNRTSWSALRGYHVGAGGLRHWGFFTQRATLVGGDFCCAQNRYASHDVLILKVPRLGNMSGEADFGAAVFVSGWPDANTILPNGTIAQWPTANVQYDFAGVLANWHLFLTAIRLNSPTDYRPRIGRVRLDVKL